MRTTRTVQMQCFALVLPVILLIGAGAASANIVCYECHGSKTPADYRPVDAPYRNITTGGFQGNHRTHLSSADSFNGCARCHPGSNNYTSSHRDGKIKLAANINNSPTGNARYRNTTTAWKQTPTPLLGTCTNVNCHFEQVTPTWGEAPLTYPGGCSVCHGAPPSGGLSGAAGSHDKHDQYYPGAANCQTCHGPSHTTFGHATSVGRPLIVAPRHVSDVQPGSYSGPVNDYLPSQGNSFGTCTNFYCHSNGTKVATGQLGSFTSPTWGSVATCDACHAYPPDYVSGSPKANSHGYPHSQSCDTCHNATTNTGDTITDMTKHVNGTYDIVPGSGLNFNYTFKTTGGTCTNVACHATRTGARDWGAKPDTDCNGCHESPPNTPSHLKHFGGTAGQAVYGSTSTAPDNATGYLFNCGNCHPINIAKHRNGSLEVELYNPSAPAGSIKSKPENAGAIYTRVGTKLYDSRGYPYYNGTCSNIYCHSYTEWTTSTGTPAGAVYDAVSTASSAAYYTQVAQASLTVTRRYQSPTWNGTLPSDCTGCHANGPRLSHTSNDGGTGDSHSWINPPIPEFGYPEEEQGHFNKYEFDIDPVTCNVCHNDTIKQPSRWARPEPTYFTTFSSVPIANFAKHVNGRNDVAFDRSQPFGIKYYDWWGNPIVVQKQMTSASYDQATKTCSNVSCHNQETSIKWGSTYRAYRSQKFGDNNECSHCHF
jgi:predicted CxxxxCH...CXXCH cytochrome family protein